MLAEMRLYRKSAVYSGRRTAMFLEPIERTTCSETKTKDL